MDDTQSQKDGFFSSFLKRIRDFKKWKTLLVVVLCFVVVLIFASSFKSKSDKTSQEEIFVSSSALAYCKEQENRLEQVLENVKGISNVKVFVMVDESPTLKYVEDGNNSSSESQNSTSSSTVLIKNGSTTKPIIVVEMLPKIKGVLVIAKGAKDLMMKSTLTNIISSVLGINISSVEVLEGT